MRFISRANYLCERIVQRNACNGVEVGVPGSKMNFALSRFGMDSLFRCRDSLSHWENVSQRNNLAVDGVLHSSIYFEIYEYESATGRPNRPT